MANPRKFSEKIALHNQKQAEETAAFERIMQEVSVTRVMGPRLPTTHLNPHPQAYLRSYLGGSLPNVNQIANNPPVEMQPGGFEDLKHPMRHTGRFESRVRPYTHTHRRMVPFELNRLRPGHMDGPQSQYPGTYLSPPPESTWRSFALSRTNSDSALHQSAMNPNPQDPFNAPNMQIHYPGRRDFMDNSFHNMQHYNKKFEQHITPAGNRPKSCEAPTINVVQSGEINVMRPPTDNTNMISGNGGPPIPISLAQGLSHVTQIGNNTGSLPDLSNLHIPSPLPNPIDVDDSQHQDNHQGAQTNPHGLYNQARSTGNLPAAIPHLGGNMRTPTSPRARRHTHNGPGPSPLSLGSPEHARRIKYPNVTSPKMVGVKSEMKSPPIGGSYTYPYPPQSGNVHSPHHNPAHVPPGIDTRGWSQPNQDHPNSPSHNQNMSSRGMQPPSGGGLQRHISNPNLESNIPLRVDVNAASKVGQPQFHRTTQGSLSSPITSPTSPTSHSQANFSPVTSPRHEFTTGSNPALSESYYRSEIMQPLQHQLEQIHVDSQHHNAAPPPMYSFLTALPESDYDSHGVSGTLNHLDGGGKRIPNNVNRIPDIVFTGVDEQNSSKTSLLGTGDMSGLMGHDFSSEYFPGDELKVNLGLDELQMLDDQQIVADPAMEDRLHLDSL